MLVILLLWMIIMLASSSRMISINITLEVIWMSIFLLSIFMKNMEFILVLSLSVISCLLLLSLLLVYIFSWGADKIFIESLYLFINSEMFLLK